MKIGSAMLVAGAIMMSAAPAGAQAPPLGPAEYAVTYLEVAPASEGDAVNLIKQVAAASCLMSLTASPSDAGVTSR